MNSLTTTNRDHFSYKQTMPAPAGREALEALETLATRDACQQVWADHQQRVAANRPYRDPVTAADLQGRIAELRSRE